MKIKLLLFILTLSALLVAALLTGIPQNTYKYITFQIFYKKIVQFEMIDDYTSQYNLLLPSDKEKIALNRFVNDNSGQSKLYSINFIDHSIKVVGNIGIVDRTMVLCMKKICTGDYRLSIEETKQYVYENGKWYLSLDTDAKLCSRLDPYDMPDEFNRAISLIIQREKQGTEIDNFMGMAFGIIKNCLHIQYAKSEGDMSGSEGYFAYSNLSSKDDLLIFVSPKYRIKDDLLTAILLSHEIAHAFSYVMNNNKSCYEQEAGAFLVQWNFLTLLNDEEKKSLESRYNLSEDVHSTFISFLEIVNQKGNSFYEKALNYVKNNEYYIKQCNN